MNFMHLYYLIICSLLFDISSTLHSNILIFMADDMGIGDSSVSGKLIEGNRSVSKNSKDTKYRKVCEAGMISPMLMPCFNVQFHPIFPLDRTACTSVLSKNRDGFHTAQIAHDSKDLVTLPEMLQQNDYFTGG